MRRAVVSMGLVLGCSGAEAHDASDADLASDAASDVGPYPFDTCDPGFRPHFLDIEPANARLFIDTAVDPPKAATLAYHVSSDLPCGDLHDVTSETTFTLDDTTFGTFEGNTFTSATSLAGAWGVAVGVTVRAPIQSGFAAIALFAMHVTGPAPDVAFDVSNCGAISPSRVVVSTTSPSTTADVTTSVTSDPSTPSIDTPSLVQSVRAMSEGDAAVGCAPRGGVDTNGDGVDDTFPAVAPGTRLCFEVLPKPISTLPRRPISQFVAAFLSLSAGGAAFDRRALVFPIPPVTGDPC